MRRGVPVTARPESLTLEPTETAVLVVDMQNAFAAKGGYLDLFGVDISGAEKVIRNVQRVLAASRPCFSRWAGARTCVTPVVPTRRTITRPTRSASCAGALISTEP